MRLAFTLSFLLFITFAHPLFAHGTNAPNTLIVHMNETGYTPQNMTAEVGTTIIFENVGNSDYWPASDSHPSHTKYSGTTLAEHCAEGAALSFDACKAVSPQTSWAFTFSTPGIHSYHDHLWPHLTGTITVEAPPTRTFLQKIEKFFSSLFSRFFSLFKNESLLDLNTKKAELLDSKDIPADLLETSLAKYKTLTEAQGARTALTTLESEAKDHDDVAAICHEILHTIGRTAYKKYGGFKEAVSFQSNYCNSGYIHGLFEAHFSTSQASTSDTNTLCDNYAADKTPFEKRQCYHGVGHGFMYVTGGDLDESLSLCSKKLSGTNADTCINGVYMEVFNGEILSKEASFITNNNPFLTCNSRTIGQYDCNLYAPTYLTQVLKMNFSEALKTCQKAAPDFRHICLSGVGSEAIKRNMNDPEEVFALCEREPTTNDRESCVSGAVASYLFQTGSIEAGVTLCKEKSGKNEALCMQIIDSSKALFGLK